MEEKENIFTCNQKVEDFESILDNADLEKIFGIQNVRVQRCSLPVKESAKNLQVVRYHQNSEIVLPKRESHSKTNSIESIRKTYEKQHIDKFNELVCRNEDFIAQFCKTDCMNSTLDESILLTLIEFVKNAQPLNRLTWKLLGKLNVLKHKYPQQYIKIDSQDILLSGNIGGSVRDVSFETEYRKPKKLSNLNVKDNCFENISTYSYKRKRLLDADFHLKPGPLSKKAKLNKLYIDFDLRQIEPVKFPPVGLEVIPSIGSPLHIETVKHLKRVRDRSGLIDASWARFASSALYGKHSDGKDCKQTFIIPYLNNQSRILMQRDLDMSKEFRKKRSEVVTKCNSSISDLNLPLNFLDNFTPKSTNEQTCKAVLSDLMNTVCIGECQDSLFESDQSICLENSLNNDGRRNKRKFRKKYCRELKKLDVTVIEIDANDKQEENCKKDFCKLGCVCNSLNTTSSIIQHTTSHCGKPQCMFNCKCKINEKSFANMLSLGEFVDSQKFHNTIICSKDQIIPLGIKRRRIKPPKRYGDYNLSIDDEKNKYKSISDVRVVLPRLPDFVTGEPWCMFHQLYRCFCKGLFVTGTKFNFSSHFENSEYKKIVDETKSLDDNVCIVIDGDFNCSRTTYDPQLIKKIKSNINSYKERNKKLKLEDSDKSNIFEESCSDNKFDLELVPAVEKISNNDKSQSISKDSNHTVKSKINNMAIVRNKKADDDTNSVNILAHNERFMNAVFRNKEKIFQILRSSNRIIPPKEGNIYGLSACSLISNFLLGKIFIWITMQPPHLQLITLQEEITCNMKCVDIKYASTELIEEHPPYTKDIINKRLSSNYHFLLFGYSFAWVIRATVAMDFNQLTKKMTTTSISGTPEPCAKPKKLNIPSSSKTKSVTLTVIPERIEIHDLTKKSNLSVKQITLFPKMENHKYWFMILVGKDFSRLSIENKKFSIKIQNIYLAINEARKKNEFIRIPSKNSPNWNTGEFFGMLIPPFVTRKYCVFVGPFKFREPINIKLIDYFPCGKHSEGNWINPRYTKIINVLNSLANCAEDKNGLNNKILDYAETSSNLNNMDLSEWINLCIGNTKPLLRLINMSPTYSFYDLYLALCEKIKGGNSISNISTDKTTHDAAINNVSSSGSIVSRNDINKENDDVLFVTSTVEILEISDSD